MSHTIPDHLESIHSISKTHLIDLNRKIGTGDTDALSSLLERARPNSQEPSIPAASLFRTLTLSSQDEASIPVEDSSTLLDMPSVGECAVHLELLEFFFALRSRIVNSSELDKTFGVEHKPKTVYRREYDSKTYKYNTTSHQVKNSGWEQQRREKWVYYLHMAVGRFMSWAEVADAAIKQESNSQSGTSLVHLPPCDVLMVWHAFLLNPADYKKYCYKNQMLSLYRAPFPWKRIHKAIEHGGLIYTLPPESLAWTEKVAHLAPDLYKFLSSEDIPEPIFAALVKYGDISPAQLWSHRPVILQNNASERLSTVEKGFIDDFLTATRRKCHAEVLVANVQRQASFVEKMYCHLWLRSPAAEGTVRRAIERYGEFLQMFKLHPETTLVPTLDIDLAWHTHQLSPLRYVAACGKRAGRFIDHDDKMAQGKLDSGYDGTKELYQLFFGKTYAACLCWDCEAIASALEKADEEHDDMLDEVDMEALADQARAEVEYHRVVELLRRKGGADILPASKVTGISH